jgi:hypothetical protein
VTGPRRRRSQLGVVDQPAQEQHEVVARPRRRGLGQRRRDRRVGLAGQPQDELVEGRDAARAADRAQRGGLAGLDVVALDGRQHALVEVLHREPDPGADAGGVEDVDGLEVARVIVLGQVEVERRRAPAAGPVLGEPARDADVARADAEVGVGQHHVGQAVLDHPGQLGLDARQRKLDDLLGQRPVAERARERAAAVGLEQRHRDPRAVLGQQRGEGAVEERRAGGREIEHALGRRGDHDVVAPPQRQARLVAGVAAAQARPHQLAERDLALGEHQRVERRVRGQERAGLVGPARHRRPAGHQERVGVGRPRRRGDRQRVARVPRVQPEAQHLGAGVRRDRLRDRPAHHLDAELARRAQLGVRARGRHQHARRQRQHRRGVDALELADDHAHRAIMPQPGAPTAGVRSAR